MLFESILGSPRLCEFDQTYSKNRNIVKYYYNLFYFDAFKMYIYSYDGKAEFSAAITLVFSQCHMILQEYDMMNCYSIHISYNYNFLKIDKF